MVYSERLPTRLNPLAERTCFSQVFEQLLRIDRLWPGLDAHLVRAKSIVARADANQLNEGQQGLPPGEAEAAQQKIDAAIHRSYLTSIGMGCEGPRAAQLCDRVTSGGEADYYAFLGVSGVSLYDSTFSRTAWRLYGGAKGLVV